MPTAISGSDERADTGPRHERDGNVFFFEYFEHADVRNSAREPAAQGDADARWPTRGLRIGRIARQLAPEGLYRPDYFPQTSHGSPHPPGSARYPTTTSNLDASIAGQGRSAHHAFGDVTSRFGRGI